MATRMTTADLKGDTARGARAISKAQAKQAAKPTKAQKQAKTVQSIEKLGLVPEWSEYKELRDLGFDRLVETRTRLKDEIEFRQKKIKELDDEIQGALAVAGAEKVTWEDRPVQIIHSKAGDRVIPEKLLLAGVPADTIADCTEIGKQYSYLLVGKPK